MIAVSVGITTVSSNNRFMPRMDAKNPCTEDMPFLSGALISGTFNVGFRCKVYLFLLEIARLTSASRRLPSMCALYAKPVTLYYTNHRHEKHGCDYATALKTVPCRLFWIVPHAARSRVRNIKSLVIIAVKFSMGNHKIDEIFIAGLIDLVRVRLFPKVVEWALIGHALNVINRLAANLDRQLVVERR